MAHSIRIRPGWLLLLVLALLAAPFAAGCGGESGEASAEDASADSAAVAENGGDEADGDGKDEAEKPKKEKAISVNAAKAIQGDLVVPVIAEGTIRAMRSGEIRAEIAGRLDRIFVEEGQTVRRGQKIAQIDNREYLVALTESRNQYLEALGRLAVDEETLDSRTATDRLEQQLAELDDLLSRGTITRREHQERTLELEVEAVKQGAYRGDLVQVRSGLAAARAAKERAELNLERTEIRAPFNGVVSGLDLNAGQRVTVNQQLCSLVDNVNLEAEVAVLESDLRGLTTGRRVLLDLPALAETLQVTVDVISPEIDTDSRTCRLLMRFKNDGGRVRPGMFVRASIAGEIYPDRLLVPREAILTRDGRPMLFKVENDRAEWVYIELGKQNDRMVEVAKILQGGPLDSGTRVVVSDHLTLTHNAKVKVKKVVEPDLAWVSASDN